MKWNEDGIKWDKMKRNCNAWSGIKLGLLYMKGNENPLSELFTFYAMTSYKIKSNDKGWSGIELLHYIIYNKMKRPWQCMKWN